MPREGFHDMGARLIHSHRHSEPCDRDAYAGKPHGDAHRHGYEHSHIHPDCYRYKYPDARPSNAPLSG